jgi:hypothetical protein
MEGDGVVEPDDGDVLGARGQWAVWQGVAYPCSAPAGGWPKLSLRARDDGRTPPGLEEVRDVYRVEPERVDAWYEACWTFRWRGEPFRSHGWTSHGTVLGRYQGEDEEFARRHLRRMVDWEADLPRDEIEDVVEHRTDLRALRGERLRLLAETDGYRPRAFAGVDGGELPAEMEADPSGRVAVGAGEGDCDGEPDTRRMVAVGELEAWWGVYWTFTIGRHPFAALGPERDTVKGKYIGDQTYGLVMHTDLLAEEVGADGRSIYTSNVYPEQITDLTEHRVDLLAD